MLVVPLTTVTGTGGRIAEALGHGVPVVASAPAAALLAPAMARLVRVGEDAAGLAAHIWELLTDDAAWEADRARIAQVDLAALREEQALALSNWLTEIAAGRAAGASSRRPGSRRALRRRRRAS